MPVRVKKTRKNKNIEHFHVSTKRENVLACALSDKNSRQNTSALRKALGVRGFPERLIGAAAATL
jgi:hypothetical protein